MANFFNWNCASDVTSLGRIAGLHAGTTITSRAGVPCMRLDVIGNDAGNQQMGVDQSWVQTPFPFIGAPALYYRWRMLVEPGFSWGAGTAKCKSSRTACGPIVNGSSQGQGYTGYLMSNGFLIGECDTAGCTVPGGGFNTDENHLIPFDFRAVNDGRWHEYIVKYKPSSAVNVADGQFEAWVDGRFVGARNGFISRATASGPLGAYTLADMWCGWMVKPYFQLNGTALDGGTIYVTDFSMDDVYNSLLGKTPPHNFEGVQLAEARKRVDPTMIALVAQLDDCYYNGWRQGQSRPFFIWDYVAGQNNKLKFDLLSGTLHHLTHLTQHLANCDHNGVNPTAAYAKYAERRYNQVIDPGTGLVVETKVRAAKRWMRDMATTWNNAGLTPVMNRTRFNQIVNYLKGRPAIAEILTRRPALDPIYDIDNETDVT